MSEVGRLLQIAGFHIMAQEQPEFCQHLYSCLWNENCWELIPPGVEKERCWYQSGSQNEKVWESEEKELRKFYLAASRIKEQNHEESAQLTSLALDKSRLEHVVNSVQHPVVLRESTGGTVFPKVVSDLLHSKNKWCRSQNGNNQGCYEWRESSTLPQYALHQISAFFPEVRTDQVF